jgi:hypothetical protein
MVLVLLVAGCQMPTISPRTAAGGDQTAFHTAVSQVIASGPGGTVLTQASGGAGAPVFADLESMLADPGAKALVNQVGGITQVSTPTGNVQTIQAGPNPATNLQGFLGNLFNQVGIGGQPGPGIQKGYGSQQSIIQSSGDGIQQSLSSSNVGGGTQQQVISNADGTVTVQEAGPAGSGVWRTYRRIFRQGNPDQPIRTETTTVTREDSCRETTRTRTTIVRPDGTRRDLLSINREDLCTGNSLGDVRAQVRVVNGERQLVGTITDANGEIRSFVRPIP